MPVRDGGCLRAKADAAIWRGGLASASPGTAGAAGRARRAVVILGRRLFVLKAPLLDRGQMSFHWQKQLPLTSFAPAYLVRIARFVFPSPHSLLLGVPKLPAIPSNERPLAEVKRFLLLEVSVESDDLLAEATSHCTISFPTTGALLTYTHVAKMAAIFLRVLLGKPAQLRRG